ncbi:MAG: histidine kinase sensor domain-containing protein [Aliiglaciecola sp.]|uniref:sensor histidine kinase n=1 Tax=Aliiglaciecola sp. TaxID=1872441 RepID=UPI003296EAE8
MKNMLFWRLCAIIGLGTVVLFWAIDWLTNHTETSMSFIAKEHQQQLLEYGRQAENILQNEGENALAVWLKELQRKEDTWAAVVTSQITPFADSILSETFTEQFRLGRNVEWKIHLYFQQNPTMEVPFSDSSNHFLIRLPQRMRPGAMLTYAKIILQIALPLILLSVLSFILYQHVMRPLRRLESTTKAFSEGNFDARINVSQLRRNDELTRLAATFDQMAERISQLINNQRQLLADLSHELRTPLTRIDMAVDFLQQQINPQQAIERLRYEANTMRNLVEDTLTLAWFNTESPRLDSDSFDLVELIQVICDDARFEYPNRKLSTLLPEKALITHSSQLSLGQAIENIIRNGLRHTPEESTVQVSLSKTDFGFELAISDQGPGVPEELLTDIFKPFFRVDKARLSNSSIPHKPPIRGFGLGLALANRQVAAVGGSITAKNIYTANNELCGLLITISLPSKNRN